MNDLTVALLDQARAFSVLEVLAVVLAVLYLILAIRQNIWCWLCAGISTAIFTWLFFDVTLYMESALNVYYLAMAVYGWLQWRGGSIARTAPLAVVKWPLRVHAAAVVAIVAVSAVSGYLLATRTNAAFPYVDSLTTWAAVWTTFLVARKVLENWWYWLLINATMVYVFWVKGLELTALLHVMYLLLIPIGLLSWTRSYRDASA